MTQDPFASPLSRRRAIDREQALSKKQSKKTYEELIQEYSQPTRILGLVDATGSMKPVWDKTRENIHELIHRLLEAGKVELSWVAYRDYCDKHRIIEQSQWSNSGHNLKNFISKITCNGGGDFPEAVEKALEIGISEQTVSRIILIGDAPPHEDSNYKELATQLGQMERPVFSFVIGSHPDTHRTFGEISKLSGGVSFGLENQNDLLDLLAITVVDEIGGKKSLNQYTNQYGNTLSTNVKKFINQLPQSKK